MRYAVVDNSTLTATQRLLGEIEVVNDVCLDGDIAAFETLIQSILFYDQTFYIDDYKEEFRQARRKSFSYLTPIEVNDFPYRQLQAAAAGLVEDINLKVTGGKIAPNEIGSFLEQLRMHTTFTWDMSSSSWFLTMKMLEGSGNIELSKYSALNDMIFLELAANRDTQATRPPSDCYSLVGSDGKPIPKTTALEKKGGKALTPQISAFAASLNWLASRTAFYTYFSHHYGADAMLHPIRGAFQTALASRLGLGNGFFDPLIKRLATESMQVTRDIIEPSDPVVAEMAIPIFSAWLVERTRSPRRIVEAALELRTEQPFRDARARLIELEEVAKEPSKTNFIREVNRLVAEIKVAGDNLRQLYGVKTKNGISISPLISIMSYLAQLKGLPAIPAIPIQIRMPDKVIELGVRGGFKGVIRSVTQDLVAVGRLGQYHEKLTSNVRYKDGEARTFLFKTEQLRFAKASSSWKQPM